MQTAAWVFGSLSIIFLMAIVAYRLAAPNARAIDETTQRIVGFFCSMVAGLFAFFFTGTVAAQITPISGRGSMLAVQATGGMALFIIMLWWWRSTSAPLLAEDRTIRSVGTSLRIVDQIYPEVEAVTQGKMMASPNTYSITASMEGDEIKFRRRDQTTPFLTITGEDLKTLNPDDRALIQALEGSMKNLFKQWTDLYPQRNSSNDPAKNKAIEAQLLRVAQELCSDLQKIFRHLGQIGMELEDHYGAMRSICYDLEQRSSS